MLAQEGCPAASGLGAATTVLSVRPGFQMPVWALTVTAPPGFLICKVLRLVVRL